MLKLGTTLAAAVAALVVSFSQALAQPHPRPGPGFPGKGGPPPFGQPMPARQVERPGAP